MKKHTFIYFGIAILLFCIGFSACENSPSDIGIGLQDPATLYDGTKETIDNITAYTLHEDSLLTSGYSEAVIGHYHDAQIGTTHAAYYAQLTNANGINMDPICVIDSVVMQLTIKEVYPAQPAGTYALHFQVDRLATSPQTDSAYYATDTIATAGTRYYDGTVTFDHSDTMIVRLPMDESIYDLFAGQTLNKEELALHTQGLRIAMAEETQSMAVVNLAASSTKMVLYYHTVLNEDTVDNTLDMNFGSSVTHFSHFKHEYASALATFNSDVHDSVSGTQYLYLEPLAGTYLVLNMNTWLSQFRTEHPNAIINYAALILPVADISDTCYPSKIQTYKRYADGSVMPIPDMSDLYTYSKYDGTNKYDARYYRILITQHLQKMLISGNDFGTLLYLDGRRTDPRRVIFNGTINHSPKPVQVEIIYTE